MTETEPSEPKPQVPSAGLPAKAGAGAGRPSPSPLPVIGGRLGIAIFFLVGMAVMSWQGFNGWIDRNLHPQEPKPVATWSVGTEANVELTLITADAKRLNCAHDTTLENLHCAYTASKRPWPRTPNSPLDDNDEVVIQPYRTADTNALILVSGVWAQPELALRLHREPPNLADIDKQLRFVAYCRVRFVGELKNASLRWETGGKWAEEPTAFVAKPVHCTLDKPTG